MTKEELIKHTEGCIERAEEESFEARNGSFAKAFAEGYLEAARHLLREMRMLGVSDDE